MFWLPKPYRNVSPDLDCIAIGGLVERPQFGLRFDDLAQLPHASQVDDAGAYASWAKVAGEPIRGVRLAALIEISGLHPEALFVIARTHSGYSASVWRREIERLAIVCYARGDEPLPVELGGPFRLLLPGFKDESRDLYDLATLEFATRRAPDSKNKRARIPRHSSAPGEVQGGLSRVVVDPAQPRTIISPPP
jgi:molybdopterin-dependent oxidoreductase-like protein protein